jgi:hypothetical protein
VLLAASLGRLARRLARRLAVELVSRAESAVKQWLRAAAFSVLETLDEFGFDVAEEVPAAQFAQLVRGPSCLGIRLLIAGAVPAGRPALVPQA